MEKSPLVSIIIVSYNTQKLLEDCIRSVERQVKSSYEILVVDNNSLDESVKMLKLKFENVLLIENKKNVGFAAANNQAIKIANGEYILLLNSDTYLESDSITPSISKLQKNPNIGVLSCKLKNKDGSLQPTGGYFPTPARLFLWMSFFDDVPGVSLFIKSFHPRENYYREDRSLDWVTGAFFLFPKSITKVVGLLDEDYFMYTEEMDFCYKVKKSGMQVQYIHTPSIVHLGRASSTNEFAIVSEISHIQLFYQKHFPNWTLYSTLVLKAGCLLRAFVYAILGKVTQKKLYEKAFASI